MLILQVVAFLFSEGYCSLKESHINLEEASQLIDKEVETVTRNQKRGGQQEFFNHNVATAELKNTGMSKVLDKEFKIYL